MNQQPVFRNQPITKGDQITFTYQNWKGIVEERTVIFDELRYGKHEYHSDQEMFILYAYCKNRNNMRAFDMSKISKLRKIEE